MSFDQMVNALAGYRLAELPKVNGMRVPREGILDEAIARVKKLEVGKTCRIKCNGTTMTRLRQRTGLALLAFDLDKSQGVCSVVRLPDGTPIKSGMKSASYIL